MLHVANLLMVSIVGQQFKTMGRPPTGTLPKPWPGVETRPYAQSYAF